jgi:hypothetical protein
MKAGGERGLACAGLGDKRADAVLDDDCGGVERVKSAEIQNPRQHMIDDEVTEGSSRDVRGGEHACNVAALGIDEKVREVVKA